MMMAPTIYLVVAPLSAKAAFFKHSGHQIKIPPFKMLTLVECNQCKEYNYLNVSAHRRLRRRTGSDVI